LLAICERQPEPATCADRLLPGLARAEGEAKLALLRTLGSLAAPGAGRRARGGDDRDESVRDTAWRALCDWPTVDALPDLARMTVGRGSRTPKPRPARPASPDPAPNHDPAAQKVAQIRELLPTIEQMKEQRLALSTLGRLPCPESLASSCPT
jgi:hypothetical protein